MRVWNISHLTGDAKYLVISGKRCSPGKSIEVDSITKKESDLVGTYLYVGDFIPTPSSNSKEALSLAECREYLLKKDKDHLLSLSNYISPALGTDLESKSVFWLASKISNAIFSESFEVSPSKFSWTNHWVRSGSGFRKV